MLKESKKEKKINKKTLSSVTKGLYKIAAHYY